MDTYKSPLKFQWKSWMFILLAICIAGASLRTVHQSDWLVFKSDQARDALIMEQAMTNGVTSLPLLGSEAGSTKFRLGPVMYYFQYASGKLFGGTPESYAYPDLLFGILTIPCLFFLLRRFFPLTLSLWLTALASVSLLLVTFSRFAWNPNSLPFFTTAFAWFFLEALECSGITRTRMLIFAALCLGIIAELHLVAILALGIGLVVFLLVTKALRWREILLSLCIVLALHLPMLAYEWQTNGANTKMFLSAASSEEYLEGTHAWYEKIFRAYQHGGRIVWLITTGQQNTDMIQTRGLSLKCDRECQNALPSSLAGMGILFFALVTVFRSWQTTEDTSKKRALFFLGLWLGGFFLVTILVAYEVETRFYLGIVPVLFIFLGFATMRLFDMQNGIWFRRALLLSGTGLLLLNLQTTITYLHELSLSQVSAEESGRDLRFGTEVKVTLGQLRAIANETKNRFTTDIPILISGESHHVKSMYYVLSAEYGYTGCYLRGTQKDIPAGFNHLFIDEYKEPLSKDSSFVPFGTLGARFEERTVYQEQSILPKGCLTY